MMDARERLNRYEAAYRNLLQAVPDKDAMECGFRGGQPSPYVPRERDLVLQETPERAALAFEYLMGGIEIDPEEILATTKFKEDGVDGIIMVKGIEFFSTCEHHLLPFYGECTIGYIPNDSIVTGLSKLPRVVDAYARRLQMQERLTNQIALCIEAKLKPRAVGVVIHAKHLCMMARGIEKQQSETTTSVLKGAFFDDDKARNEFFSFVDGRQIG